MLTPRENYMELVNGGKPDRFVNQYEPFEIIVSDPYIIQNHHMDPTSRMGRDTLDAWGTTIRWLEGDHAAMPYITDDNKVCPDITQWRKTVKAPPLDFPAQAWENAKRDAEAVDRKEKMVTGLMVQGLFEQLHFLMGFEDALINLLLEPEAMHELLDYILDYKMEYAKKLIDTIQPDAILFHDDLGSKDQLFFNNDIWREFFYPRYEKLYGYVKGRGVHIVHHGDSHMASIVEDMADLGISTWQGVLPSNDIPALQKRLKGRMILMGGVDAGVVDLAAWNEETIREEVQRACREYTPGGGFIPALTYGLPEAIFPGVFELITEEIDNQSKIYSLRVNAPSLAARKE